MSTRLKLGVAAERNDCVLAWPISLEPGEFSAVVETQFGFHIILVEERDEDRELDAAMLNQRMTDAFQTWLFDLEAAATIEKYWSVDKLPPEQ